ncbi:hypothetical protein D3OALGA1CA_745 [Olavius algarvensis associated proteobacterium Delta 3]|nr:hypothetical protein D3OALGA1CA_745 [Olavius algarvensis associated proteobacterium Delta 3]CAB5140490.1 hypothetical protein D3OALGB2SA_4205 [Olavius algarvensis associated proteobacterium Delta 3]
MGFFRQQEEKLAVRLLAWHYERMNLPVPPPSDLKHQAARLVEEAHHIAKERGSNVMSIIKDLVADLKKEKR